LLKKHAIMTLLFRHLLILIIIIQTACSQTPLTYDKNKISTDTELNFSLTDKRGIESKTGIIYFVEKDLQTLSAYEKGKVLWQTNIITTCGKPAIGEPAIRYIKLDTGKVNVTFGKHSFASVDIINGKTTYLGAD
jgi:hypothetical protein